MIKVRTTEGKVYKMTPTARFVELCDRDGKLAAVVFIGDNGLMRVMSPGDEDFAKYVKTYQPEVTAVIEA